LTMGVPQLQARATMRRESPIGLPTQALAINSVGTVSKSSPAPAPACTKLTNAGSYFTATIHVGTAPGKSFDVVADTGSNSVIVTSCDCDDCDFSVDRCFQASDCAITDPPCSSTTLHVNQTSDGKVPVVQMGFGSGTIEAEIGSDHVKIGTLQAFMHDQLLLMVDKKLDLKGKFEGILGLGIPEDGQPEAAGSIDKDKAIGDSSVNHTASGSKYVTKGFMEMAGVTRFSMCFEDTGNQMDGTLIIGGDALTNPLGSVGTKHWGLDFRGISVGSTTAPIGFCTPAEKTAAGRQTACGAIPDSGTTLILGPTAQLVTLYEEICDAWPRCVTELATNSQVADGSKTKSDLVEIVLANCAAWINETDQGLDELPELTFHVHGNDGTGQPVTFKGSQYIESGDVDDDALFTRKTLSNKEPMRDFLLRQTKSQPKARSSLVCLPALGPIDYETTENGPVWILGTPLFYANKVSFESNPPSIEITSAADSPCTACADTTADPQLLVSLGGEKKSGREKRSPTNPRRIQGEARGPSTPMSGPL